MNHSVLIFDKATEEFLSEVAIPARHVEQLKVLMGWVSEEEEIYEYPLLSTQLRGIEQLLDRKLESLNCIYQLFCSA